MALHERVVISFRTKTAIAAVKAQGEKRGSLRIRNVMRRSI
jgi:hypothetical protein